MFVLTGPVLLELMMSDFSPVPFVFINIISRGEEGMMLFLSATIQTVAIDGGIESLGFDDSSIL